MAGEEDARLEVATAMQDSVVAVAVAVAVAVVAPPGGRRRRMRRGGGRQRADVGHGGVARAAVFVVVAVRGGEARRRTIAAADYAAEAPPPVDDVPEYERARRDETPRARTVVAEHLAAETAVVMLLEDDVERTATRPALEGHASGSHVKARRGEEEEEADAAG